MTENKYLGMLVGITVGVTVGIAVGIIVGIAVGIAVGIIVGTAVGIAVGVLDGIEVGIIVGIAVGIIVGTAVGVLVGNAIGIAVGTAVGVTVVSTTFRIRLLEKSAMYTLPMREDVRGKSRGNNDERNTSWIHRDIIKDIECRCSRFASIAAETKDTCSGEGGNDTSCHLADTVIIIRDINVAYRGYFSLKY